MKHLAIFYTNNNTCIKALKESLNYFSSMVNYPLLPFDTTGLIISALPVSELLKTRTERTKNVIAPKEILNKGHLSIIEKISLALNLFPSDYVSLHEYDVLYPEEYLFTIQDIIEEVSANFDYLAYNNIIGVNKTGYQRRIVADHPLSTLTFPYNVIRNLLDNKRKEFYLNKSWCYLEPGYGGSYGSHLQRVQLGNGSVRPAIHINMNETAKNHHFTNHYLTYEPVSTSGFNEWPGNLAFLFE